MGKNMVLIIVTLAMAFSLCGFVVNVHAKGGGHGLSGWHYHPAPLTVPPPVPPWFPHGFPQLWSTDDVITILNEQGLDVKEIEKDTDVTYALQSARAKEVMGISIPLEGAETEGYIFSFELKDDLEKMAGYYREMNNRGDLHTWSFVSGNILLILPGALSEEEARQYESALRRIN
ncbi:MAG: hypothetical protein JSU90_11225 [Nitrospiraceae bacterium]|nr:MAG: hypothetical protein JSU90_11225 [Nitrospiraceae bacterium]